MIGGFAAETSGEWKVRVHETTDALWLKVYGPEGQQAAFDVPRDSVRAEVLRQYGLRPETTATLPEQLFRTTTNGRLYRVWGDVSDCSEGTDDEKRMIIYAFAEDSEPMFAREASEFRTYFKPDGSALKASGESNG